jgi:outer membrane murein-binding lipoprotein Lpp
MIVAGCVDVSDDLDKVRRIYTRVRELLERAAAKSEPLHFGAEEHHAAANTNRANRTTLRNAA